MKKINVEITGTAPLLQHRFATEEQRLVEAWNEYMLVKPI